MRQKKPKEYLVRIKPSSPFDEFVYQNKMITKAGVKLKQSEIEDVKKKDVENVLEIVK